MGTFKQEAIVSPSPSKTTTCVIRQHKRRLQTRHNSGNTAHYSPYHHQHSHHPHFSSSKFSEKTNMADANLAPPQPDFGQISTAFRTAADNFSLCNNLPSVVGGEGISAALADISRAISGLNGQVAALRTDINSVRSEVGNLRNEVTTVRNDLTTVRSEVADLRNDVGSLRTEMRDGFDRLEKKIDSTQANAIARTMNTTAVRANSRLEPLVKHDGEPIANFPGTVEELNALTGPSIATILRELGAPANGTLLEKKKRLRMHVGAINQSVD